MVELVVIVYESRYADGHVYRETFPVDVLNRYQRALAAMMRQENEHGPVLSWSAYRGVVTYDLADRWYDE